MDGIQVNRYDVIMSPLQPHKFLQPHPYPRSPFLNPPPPKTGPPPLNPSSPIRLSFSHQALHGATHEGADAFDAPVGQPAQDAKAILFPARADASLVGQGGQTLLAHGAGVADADRVDVVVLERAEGGDAERGQDGVMAEGEAGGEGAGGGRCGRGGYGGRG